MDLNVFPTILALPLLVLLILTLNKLALREMMVHNANVCAMMDTNWILPASETTMDLSVFLFLVILTLVLLTLTVNKPVLREMMFLNASVFATMDTT